MRGLWEDVLDDQEVDMPFTESVPETTQIRAPWKAVARTGLALISSVALLVEPVLDAVADGDSSTLGAWAVTSVAVGATITRVLALPGVERFLRRFAPWLAAGATDTPEQ